MHHTALRAFPRSASAPRDARRYVAEVLSAWHVADTCAAILLALSELVTNAVTHGRGLVKVRLALHRSVLRVEVEDEGPGLPATRCVATDADDIGGRGLCIVDKVADALGHSRPGEDRSVVWLEARCAD
jgi:anti-sigma regulatory factor (Ser/Thr protein kinase)